MKRPTPEEIGRFNQEVMRHAMMSAFGPHAFVLCIGDLSCTATAYTDLTTKFRYDVVELVSIEDCNSLIDGDISVLNKYKPAWMTISIWDTYLALFEVHYVYYDKGLSAAQQALDEIVKTMR